MAATRLRSPSSSALNDLLTLFLCSLFCLVHFEFCFAQRYGFSRWVRRASGCKVGPCHGDVGLNPPRQRQELTRRVLLPR